MLGFTVAIVFLLVTIWGYVTNIKMSKLEREIRKSGKDYECFECKAKFSPNERKCPNCSFITLYGKRREKYWIIFPMIVIWFFLVLKWNKFGIFE